MSKMPENKNKKLDHSHCCVDMNCVGRYNGRSLNCKLCDKIIYISCIKDRFLPTYGLLKLFGLIIEDDKNNYSVSNDVQRWEKFYNVFDAVSPFGIICHACLVEFKLIKQTPTTDGERKEVDDRAQVQANGVGSCDNTSNPGMRPTCSSESVKLDLFVSRFPKSTTCNEIQEHILKHLPNLNVNNFTVDSVLGPKANVKYLKFMAFKISAKSKAIYDALLDPDVWKPFSTAVPFNEARNASKHKTKQKPKVMVSKTATGKPHYQQQQIQQQQKQQQYQQLHQKRYQHQNPRQLQQQQIQQQHKQQYQQQHWQKNQQPRKVNFSDNRNGVWECDTPANVPMQNERDLRSFDNPSNHRDVQGRNFSEINDVNVPGSMQYQGQHCSNHLPNYSKSDYHLMNGYMHRHDIQSRRYEPQSRSNAGEWGLNSNSNSNSNFHANQRSNHAPSDKMITYLMDMMHQFLVQHQYRY